MKNHHLKKRGKLYTYRRRVPTELVDTVGKRFVEKALKTSDPDRARKLRDAEDRRLETEWSKLRRLVPAAQPTTNQLDEESPRRAYREYVEAERAGTIYGVKGDPRGVPAILPADPYIQRLYDLHEDLMDRHGLDDQEAHDRMMETTEGRRLMALAAAAQGAPPIDVAGEEYLEAGKLKPETKRLYRGIYKHAAKHLNPPPRVTPEEARKYLQGVAKERSAQTAGNYKAALKGLWEHLGRDETIWTRFKLRSPQEAIDVRAFTDEELAGLLQRAKGKLRDAILIAAYTGVRVGELAELKYDAANDWLLIEKSKTKSGIRSIPCPDAVREIVKEWVKAPWRSTTISNRFNELKTELGFKQRAECFHSLRHGFATRMHELGVQEATVARMIGQKHPQITFGLYGDKIKTEALRAPINRLSYENHRSQQAIAER